MSRSSFSSTLVLLVLLAAGAALAAAVVLRSGEAPEPPGLPDPLSRLEGFGRTLEDRDAARAALEADAPKYAWDLFLWLNQPVAGGGPKHWETSFRQTSTIYLPDGRKPAPWGSDETPAEVQERAAQLSAAPGGTCAPPGVWHDLDTAIQVDGLALLDRWNTDVRYQLLMNRPAFDYLVSRGFYNVDGQEAAAREGKPADFPWTAYELKTSWIWIGQDPERCAALRDRFYVVNAYFQRLDDDGRPAGWEVGWAALAGMHIINKTLPDWVWITFENVNAPDFTRARLELPLAADVQAANQRYQAALRAAGSILAEYQLDGVQVRFTEGGERTLLANSTIESAFQPESSCITCHGLASIRPDGEYFDLVRPGTGDLAYYTGDPPDVGAQGFTRLDFVWSMKRAFRERTP
ncbi:MAG TPA: hypothetical protein VM599_06930 [Thermoanaerobaculia bacterium]|nr:hypothetical protein [Thermoanaerobaculia bacterium]